MALQGVICCLLVSIIFTATVWSKSKDKNTKILATLPPSLPLQVVEPHCEYEGVKYKLGEEFWPGPCMFCHCASMGQYYCSIIDCIQPPCWDAVYPSDQCCGICPNGPNCIGRDTILQPGENVTFDDGTTCFCDKDLRWGPAAALCIMIPTIPSLETTPAVPDEK